MCTNEGGNVRNNCLARAAWLLFLSAVFLSGCLDPPAAVGGSTNSGVRSLKVGMSPLKSAGIIGTYQVEKIARLPGRIQACRSYIYDEKQLRVQFVHVLFRNEKLVSATDGHAKTCKIKN